MKNLTNKFLILILGATLLVSCSGNSVYNDYKELPVSGWSKDSCAKFTVPIKDTQNNYRVLLNVRNRGDYQTQNLWLFVSYQLPNKAIMKDTLECYLADNKGKWLGSGFGSMYDMPVIYLKSIKFPQAGNYTFCIKHGMRDSSLVGINDIGLEIQKLD